MQYLSSNGLLPDLQSAYIPHRSTETAILRILSDILLALDSGNLAILALLDLSAAFDSVDHDTLLTRLRLSYGLTGAVLNWFKSYLTGRTQSVRCSSSHSSYLPVLFGVPQGSVLGPHSLLTVCCWSAFCHPPPPAHTPLLCRRHSNLRVLHTLGNQLSPNQLIVCRFYIQNDAKTTSYFNW